MAFGGLLVVGGALREGEAVLDPRIEFHLGLDVIVGDGGGEGLDHLQGRPAVDLGAAEIELGIGPFGGEVGAWTTFGGVTIPSRGTVGWWYGTDRWADGEFFRYEIDGYELLDGSPSDAHRS